LPPSRNVEDRRGGGGGFAGRRAGGIGLGTLIVCVVLGWALGINPLYLIGGAEILSGLRGGSQQQSEPAPRNGGPEAPSDRTAQFVSAVLGSTEVVWKQVFAQGGKSYEPPALVMFSGAARSECGFAQAAMGPFYCPLDQKVYLDTSFFDDLERRFRGCEVGSKSCQFSQAYVITHEVGHHVQNLLGILPAGGAAGHGPGRFQPTAGPR
jgi:predicted metalloprotease